MQLYRKSLQIENTWKDAEQMSYWMNVLMPYKACSPTDFMHNKDEDTDVVLDNYDNFKNMDKSSRNSTPQLKKVDLDKFPVYICAENERKSHNEIVQNVDLLLQLYKDIQTVTLPEKNEQLKQRIAYSEKQIDKIIDN
jgi:hypothetical protein